MIKRSAKRWITAWLQIFDCLVSIITLQFYFCETAIWWYGKGFEYGKEPLMSINERVSWWICEWIFIFEELLVIVTLSQLDISFLGETFMDWRKL